MFTECHCLTDARFEVSGSETLVKVVRLIDDSFEMANKFEALKNQRPCCYVEYILLWKVTFKTDQYESSGEWKETLGKFAQKCETLAKHSESSANETRGLPPTALIGQTCRADGRGVCCSVSRLRTAWLINSCEAALSIDFGLRMPRLSLYNCGR